MFKRVRWMGMGAAAGFGASMWAQRRLRRTLDDHPTIRAGAQAAAKARSLGLEIRDALIDGRQAMAQREAALRADLDARLIPIRPDQQSDLGRARGPRRVEGALDAPRLRVVEATSSEPVDGTPRAAATAQGARDHPALGEGGTLSSPPDGPDGARTRRRGLRRLGRR